MKRPAGVPRAAAPSAGTRLPVVLLVCQANVCRSRAAEVLLRRRLASAGLALDVRSAGTSAPAHARRCPAMDRLLVSRGHDLPVDDGTHQLDTTMLERASLVLVAERRQRAQAARLDPAARSRTFTLVEAAGLAAAVPPVHHGSPGSTPDEALREVVAGLHASRGAVALPDAPAGRLALPWRRPAAAGIDLLDVHERSSRVHARSLHRIDQALEAVVTLLGSRLPR